MDASMWMNTDEQRTLDLEMRPTLPFPFPFATSSPSDLVSSEMEWHTCGGSHQMIHGTSEHPE